MIVKQTVIPILGFPLSMYNIGILLPYCYSELLNVVNGERQ